LKGEIADDLAGGGVVGEKEAVQEDDALHETGPAGGQPLLRVFKSSTIGTDDIGPDVMAAPTSSAAPTMRDAGTATKRLEIPFIDRIGRRAAHACIEATKGS
jgi:hypothetical protein